MVEHKKLNCLVVSLPGATGRRKAITENLLQRADLHWRFFDALEPQAEEVDLPADRGKQIELFGRALAPGEIGCYKSHYAVLKELAARDEWLLVLEDDVWIDPDFDFREVTGYADRNDLDYVWLFAKFAKPSEVIGMLSGFRQVIRYRTDPYGTQAYLIHSRGAKRFLAAQTCIVRPIDDELGRFWIHGLWPIAVFPFPAVERSMRSTIAVERDAGNTRRKKWQPRLLAHRAVEKLRKIGANLRGP